MRRVLLAGVCLVALWGGPVSAANVPGDISAEWLFNRSPFYTENTSDLSVSELISRLDWVSSYCAGWSGLAISELARTERFRLQTELESRGYCFGVLPSEAAIMANARWMKCRRPVGPGDEPLRPRW